IHCHSSSLSPHFLHASPTTFPHPLPLHDALPIFAEAIDGVSYRPASRISQGTYRSAFHLCGHIEHEVKVLYFALTIFNFDHYLFEPSRTIAAGRTLAT